MECSKLRRGLAFLVLCRLPQIEFEATQLQESNAAIGLAVRKGQQVS